MSEIRRAFQGAWLLAHADPGGLACFDRSIDGFWRSFRAAVIVAPGYAFLVALQYAALPPPATPLRIACIEAITYVIGWVAYPLAMEWVCRLLDRERAYVGYVVVYNWSALVQVAALVLAVILSFAMPDWLAGLVVRGVQLVLMVYIWTVARIALDVDALRAGGIVILDFALSFAIHGVAEAMIY